MPPSSPAPQLPVNTCAPTGNCREHGDTTREPRPARHHALPTLVPTLPLPQGTAPGRPRPSEAGPPPGGDSSREAPAQEGLQPQLRRAPASISRGPLPQEGLQLSGGPQPQEGLQPQLRRVSSHNSGVGLQPQPQRALQPWRSCSLVWRALQPQEGLQPAEAHTASGGPPSSGGAAASGGLLPGPSGGGPSSSLMDEPQGNSMGAADRPFLLRGCIAIRARRA